MGKSADVRRQHSGSNHSSAESYSRSVTPRASPGLLHRELLLVCYTESYSRSAMLRKQRHIQGPTIMQTATTSNIMQRNKRTPRTVMAPTSLCYRTAHCQLLEVSNASAPQAHKYWRTIGQIQPRLRHVMQHPNPFWKRPRHPHSQDHFRSHCTS